jgi:hypothetical protein
LSRATSSRRCAPRWTSTTTGNASSAAALVGQRRRTEALGSRVPDAIAEAV